MIYLDNSATTFPKPECVYQAMDYANRNLAFNAGRGSYGKAIEAADVILEARRNIADFAKCTSDEVVFTSSATESLNLIINGLPLKDGDNVYISPFEHNAIVRPLYNLKKQINFNIFVLPFDKETWEIDEEKMTNMFAINSPAAVLISHVSNVTGFELPYQKIFEHSKMYYSINVLDSAQCFGISNPCMKNIDFCVFAGHKSLYATFGIAGFINHTNLILKVIKSGGNGADSLNHEMPKDGYAHYESGSPNVVACYGLIKSCQWLRTQNILENEKKLTFYLINKMSALKSVKMYLPKNKQVLGIVSLNVAEYTPLDVGNILFEDFGICVRTGYHCSPFVHDFLGTKEIGGTVRISLGAFNTKEDIDNLYIALESF